MSGMYLVVCITDAGTTQEKMWTKNYDNALDAVRCFESFVDHATCVLDRVVTLTVPNGRTHRKVFKYPYRSAADYEAACVKWRNQQFDPILAVK